MAFCPILARDLTLDSRRPILYRGRVGSVLLGIVVVTLAVAIWWLENGRTASTAGLPRLIRLAAASVLALQGLQVLMMVPSLVVAAIGGEKDRKTLDDLLTTRLTSAEIVLGALASGLVRSASAILGGFPVAFLLLSMGGGDPASIALFYAALASTAFLVGALSALAAVEAPTSKAGLSTAALLGLGWIALPILSSALLPRYLPGLHAWTGPVVWWLLASNPIVVGSSRVGLPIFGTSSVGEMIGLQCLAGSLIVARAIARLRPAYRVQIGGGRGIRRATRPYRPRRRPPVGDQPVLWKELHTSRNGTNRVAGLLVYGVAGSILGPMLYFLARPAVGEVLEFGYGASGSDFNRVLLNQVVRLMTAALAFVGLLLAAALPGEALALERAGNTWVPLVSTPLTGREILRAKMMGGLWSLRPLAALMGIFWVVGLLAGAIHPIGFALAMVQLGLAAWLFAALGAYCSVLSGDRATATNLTALSAMALTFSPMLAFFGRPGSSIFWGAASPAFTTCLALVSHRDLRDYAQGEPFGFLFLGSINMASGEGLARVLAVAAINPILCTLGAIGLGRAAFAGFDRAVDRPRRDPSSASPPAASIDPRDP